LSVQDIYAFSDSIDVMRYCIVVRPLPTETYHLVATNKVERDEWLVLLKRCCKPVHPAVRTIYSITVRITEGKKFQVHHKDSAHHELYCDIVIDNEIKAITGSLKKASNLFWKEDFIFPDVTKVKHGVTIIIYTRRSKKSERESVYGTVFLPVNEIRSNGPIQEEWYEIRKENRHKAFASLTGLGSSNGSLGQLRVGLLSEEHKVYSLDVYQPLIDILMEFRHDIIYSMARKSSDVQAFVRNLLRIYEGIGITLTWMRSLIDYEVSLLNSVIDNYMKMNGKEFLEEALQYTIRLICEQNLHIEVESSRTSTSMNDATLAAHCAELFDYVRSIWGGVQRAKNKFPMYNQITLFNIHFQTSSLYPHIT
ncbi:hypothetical protein BDB01DRAFT_713006, partial [Pilobolus umbonatus]